MTESTRFGSIASSLPGLDVEVGAVTDPDRAAQSEDVELVSIARQASQLARGLD